jgi:signal peptidase I
MNFFERRRWYKTVRHLLHEASHARRMREDVVPSEKLDALALAEAELRRAWDTRDRAVLEKAAANLADAVDAILPPKYDSRMREHVEIFTVAIVLALAVRTYFIQPFKIPTGSMQPTLYGISAVPQEGRRLVDRFPVNLFTMALFGERYVEIRARTSGLVYSYGEVLDDEERFYVGNEPHLIRRNMKMYFKPGETRVEKGQLLASGVVRLGDHIFVNKVIYNFQKPERGDIFVFSTDHIQDERVQVRGKGTFYIKRLVGLPGEDISLAPPYLVVDGKAIDEPYPFHRLVHAFDKGYVGYQFPSAQYRSLLSGPRAHMKLGERQYLPLGDNTLASLDGRFFGPVHWRDVVGPAFMVYWPLGKRWGWWIDAEDTPWD